MRLGWKWDLALGLRSMPTLPRREGRRYIRMGKSGK